MQDPTLYNFVKNTTRREPVFQMHHGCCAHLDLSRAIANNMGRAEGIQRDTTARGTFKAIATCKAGDSVKTLAA